VKKRRSVPTSRIPTHPRTRGARSIGRVLIRASALAVRRGVNRMYTYKINWQFQNYMLVY
jgi:hypothetical protein